MKLGLSGWIIASKFYITSVPGDRVFVVCRCVQMVFDDYFKMQLGRVLFVVLVKVCLKRRFFFRSGLGNAYFA